MDTTESNITDITPETLKQLLRLGGAMAELRELPGGDLLHTFPIDFKSERLEDPDKIPAVTRRHPTFTETSSFIDYVCAFKKADQTRIFANAEALKIVAVIDYDKTDAADRGEHRATLQLSQSPEWTTWAATAAQTVRQGLTQEEFAEFLEQNDVDVVTPTAAELMELISNMQVTRNVTYRKSFNLTDGRRQFHFTNDGESGNVEFPARLILGIPVFKGGERYRVEVILRYRLQDNGTLRFAMIIYRKDEILRTALMGNGADIEGDILAIQSQTGVPVHMGVVE